MKKICGNNGGIMNIVGHGIDIVDAARYGKLFEHDQDRHLRRYFSKRELVDVSGDTSSLERLASRLAMKEAVMKALRHGFGDGLGFTDIEILSDPDGAPTVNLHRKAAQLAEDIGVREWWISMSQSGGFAVASAIACG